MKNKTKYWEYNFTHLARTKYNINTNVKYALVNKIKIGGLINMSK